MELSTLPASDSVEIITSSNPETIELSILPASDSIEMIASSDSETVELSTLPASDFAEMIASFNPETMEASTLPASNSAEKITSSNPERVNLSTFFPASDSPENTTSSSLEIGDLSTLFPTSDSAESVTSSNPEIMDQTPGMWQVRRDPNVCCIYRVPDYIRHGNPEAYTPQVVLVGPLHHFLKSEALKCRGDITNTKAMNYLNMERHKKIYLAHFARRRGGSGEKEVIDEFRKIIKEEEGMIRASYSESTDWISSSDFVEMIMLDCVFILELLIKKQVKDMLQNKPIRKTGDPLLDEESLLSVVLSDLILLENQIPYYMLEKLYGVCIQSCPDRPLASFRELAWSYLSQSTENTKDNSQFKHFTDMRRCVHVETLHEHFLGDFEFDEYAIMYHADKLHSGGVKFKAVDKKHSLNVEFKNGCLHIPTFLVDDSTEEKLRNIIALEQCHYGDKPHVSNYIWFLDLLIDTEKDVELLVEKGIIRHTFGDHSEMATMVNRLCKGALVLGSQYNVIAKDVQKHYNNSWTKSSVILRTVYFSNLWRGTATVAAMFLLLLTLVQTVFSILQFLSNPQIYIVKFGL